MWELFLPTYTTRGNPGPAVLFVDDVHQEQPQEPRAFARGPPAGPAPAYLLRRPRTRLALQFFGSSRPCNDVPGEQRPHNDVPREQRHRNDVPREQRPRALPGWKPEGSRHEGGRSARERCYATMSQGERARTDR